MQCIKNRLNTVKYRTKNLPQLGPSKAHFWSGFQQNKAGKVKKYTTSRNLNWCTAVRRKMKSLVELMMGKKNCTAYWHASVNVLKKGALETCYVIRQCSYMYRMSLNLKFCNLVMKRKIDIRTTLWLAPRLNPPYSGSLNLMNYLPRAKVSGCNTMEEVM